MQRDIIFLRNTLDINLNLWEERLVIENFASRIRPDGAQKRMWNDEFEE